MKTLQQLAHENKDNLLKMEELLRYKFADSILLQQSLVHSSYGFEQLDTGLNNETLEFLGDAEIGRAHV